MFTIQIFLALFIFILMVLISVEDLATGFLFLLILMPLQHKELFSLAYWDVLPIRVAFFGILLSTSYRFYLWFRRSKNIDYIKGFLKDPVLILLLVLYIIRFISILFVAQEKFEGFKLLAFYTTVVYFYILLKFLYLKKGISLIKKYTFVYVLLASLMGLVAVIQFYVFKVFDLKFGAIWEIPGHNPRLGSTFWDVNHFGAFVASAIPLSIAWLVSSKKINRRLFWLFNTLFLSYALYLTQSRSSWMGIAIALFFFFLFLFLKGFKKYATYLAVFSALGLFSILFYLQVFSGGILPTYKKFMHTRLDSFKSHFVLLRGAFEVYEKKPLLGAGYGNFNNAFRKTSYSDTYFFREKNIVDKKVPSHSIWGEVVAETGFLGLFFYSLLFSFILLFLLKGFFGKKSIKDSLFQLGFFASILSMLVSGIFYTYNLEFFWFAIFLGAIFAFENNKGFNLNSLYKFLVNNRYLVPLTLVLISSLLIFWDLNRNTFIDWDEAIYAKVAKNIVVSKNWLTLQWSIGTPWFEKPPLYMWFSAFFMFFLGINELSARLPSALLGFSTVLMVYLFGKKFLHSRWVGFVAGIILLTTADFLYYARLSMLDVSVSFFIFATLYFSYAYFEKKKKKDALLAGVFCGLGVMTKAIVGLLPLGVIGFYGLYLLWQKKITLREIVDFSLFFVFSFLVIILPWHLYMYAKYGKEFTKTYIFEHIINRGLTDQQGKTQPFYWYIIRLKVSMRYWFLLLIPSFFYSFYQALKNNKKYVFLLTYALFVFLFFSISHSKLVWYVIPVYPALALICALSLKDFILYFSKRTLRFPKLVLLGSFGLFLTLFVGGYVLEIKDLVYRPDFNKDLVAVIEDYNEKYYDQKINGTTLLDGLYYLRIAPPTVLFYTEGEAISSDREPLRELIDSAPFNKAFVYISRKGEVSYLTDIYGGDRVLVSSQRGKYYLTYVRSEEEYYVAKAQELRAEILAKIAEYPQVVNKEEAVKEIRALQDELFAVEDLLHQKMPNKYPKSPRIYFSP